ncbi:MAG: metallophosphoesterase [Salinirussus sp.]
MMVAIGDTHSQDDHRLDGPVLDAVRRADRVVHTGDFTHEPVYDSLQAEAKALHAVAGNNDDPALASRLPETRTLQAFDRRVVVIHGHRHDETARSLLVRQEAADILVVGHSHRPRIRHLDDALEVNPGSYAEPRWYDAAFAVFERDNSGPVVRLKRTDGAELDRTRL